MSRHATTITVQDVPVTVMQVDQSDYISLTDMAKARTDSTRAADVIKNWLRTRSTLEFLGTWEVMYNPDFKVVEFDHFKNEAGLHTFTLSAKEWIEKTNAIIESKKDWRDDVVGYFTKKWNERVTIIKAGIGLAKKLLGMKKKEKTEEEKLEEMSSDFVGECKAQFPADGEWLEGHEKVSCAVTEDV